MSAAYEELKSEVKQLNSSSEVENVNLSLSNEDHLLEKRKRQITIFSENMDMTKEKIDEEIENELN